MPIAVGGGSADAGPDWANFMRVARPATANAVNEWKSRAGPDGYIGTIMATACFTKPGEFLGGTNVEAVFERNVMAALTASGAPERLAKVFSCALGDAWEKWARGFCVNALHWYPAFAAFAGPMAPPMPNVPTPLAASGKSGGDTELYPGNLIARIRANLSNAAVDVDDRGTAAIVEFALRFASATVVWRAACLVIDVLGAGLCPTFAPPYVPVAPVVGGFILPTHGDWLQGNFPPF
jgi:hypothetical protein